MRNLVIGFIIGFLLGGLGMYFIMKGEIKEIEVPIKIEVPVPVIEKQFDTIKLPAEIIKLPGETIIDSTYFTKYQELKTQMEKDSVFKDAITIREYRPFVEDDTIRIDIYSKVRGTLLENQISYKTKPYNISLDTTVTVQVPQKGAFYVGGSILYPYRESELKPSLKGAINHLNKKHNKIYNLQIDPLNETIEVGITFRF